MASTFSNLGFELQTTGENANTWGDKTNVNLELIDERLSAIGTITNTSSFSLPAPSNATKSVNNGAATLKFTGSASSTIVVTMPAKTLLYNVVNSTGQDLTFQCSTTTTTATIKNGQNGTIHSDGSANVYLISTVANDFDDDVTIKTNDGALLTLQTSDTDITDGEVLGALQFQAPDEAGGTDATTVAASIVAEADDTFASDSNKTDLVFKLGSSEAATEAIRFEHEGNISLSKDDRFIFFGENSDVTLRHVHNTGLLLNSTNQLQFGDSGTYIHQSADGVLDLVSDTEIEINATTIDVNGNLDVSGTMTSAGALTTAGIVVGSASLQEADLVQIDAITPGTVSASKAVIVDSSKDITGFRNITATNNITAFSDERLKSDIETIDNALDKVMNMRGVSFTKQAEKGIGVIAQEVEKVLPEVVTDGEYKSVAYGNIVGVLIEAIKDLKQELDEHKEGCKCK